MYESCYLSEKLTPPHAKHVPGFGADSRISEYSYSVMLYSPSLPPAKNCAKYFSYSFFDFIPIF